MSLLVHYFLFGALGFCVSFLVLRRQVQGDYWRSATRRAVQLHHGKRGVVPRFGGIALAAAFVVLSLAVGLHLAAEQNVKPVRLSLFFGTLAMFALGLLDDFRPLGARKKLVGQIVIALGVYLSGLSIDTLRNPFTDTVITLGGWSVPITLLWLVGLTNLMNLIDGIDGLAGGMALMLMGLLSYMGLGSGGFGFLVSIGMAGALLAFLRFNFPPAKIYMGDGGAYMLGFLIAGLALVHSQKGTLLVALLAPMLALGLPIADTSVAVLRRGLAGLPLFRADRKHLHYKIQDLGFDRRRTVMSLYLLSVPCLLLGFVLCLVREQFMPLLFGVMFVVLAGGLWKLGVLRDLRHPVALLKGVYGLRRESRYALSMFHWLQMEAERTLSVSQLWQQYEFMLPKLGFLHARLELDDGHRLWEADGVPFDEPTLLRSRHELNGSDRMVLEFTGAPEAFNTRTFEHLSGLAAEGWVKAARRWGEVRKAPVRFDAETVGR